MSSTMQREPLTIRGLRVPSSFRLEPDAIRVPLCVLRFLYVSRPLLSPPVVSSLQVLALRSLFLHRHSTTRANPSWRCGPPKRGLVQSSTCLLKLYIDALSSNFLAIHNITDQQALGYSMTKVAIVFLAWIICSLAQAADLSGESSRQLTAKYSLTACVPCSRAGKYQRLLRKKARPAHRTTTNRCSGRLPRRLSLVSRGKWV